MKKSFFLHYTWESLKENNRKFPSFQWEIVCGDNFVIDYLRCHFGRKIVDIFCDSKSTMLDIM